MAWNRLGGALGDVGRGLNGFGSGNAAAQRKKRASTGGETQSLRDALRARGGATPVPSAATDIEDNEPREKSSINLDWLDLKAYAPKSLQQVVDRLRAGERPAAMLRHGSDTDGSEETEGESASASPDHRVASSGSGSKKAPSGLKAALQARGGVKVAQAAVAAPAASAPEDAAPAAAGDTDAAAGGLPHSASSGSHLASVAEDEEEAEDAEDPPGGPAEVEKPEDEASASASAPATDPEGLAGASFPEETGASLEAAVSASAPTTDPECLAGASSPEETGASLEELRPPDRATEDCEAPVPQEVAADPIADEGPGAPVAEAGADAEACAVADTEQAPVAEEAKGLCAAEAAAAAATATATAAAEREAEVVAEAAAPTEAEVVASTPATSSSAVGPREDAQQPPGEDAASSAPARAAEEVVDKPVLHKPGAGSNSRIGSNAFVRVDRGVSVTTSATGYPLAMPGPKRSPREGGEEEVPDRAPLLAAAPPRQQAPKEGKLKDIREFWGQNKSVVGFAGPQLGGSRISRNEAQAALQRLVAAGGDFDEVRRLRRLIAELE